MSDGLKRALDIEIGKKLKQPENLVLMPQEILARVDRKGDLQLSIDELQLVGNYVLSSVAEIGKSSGLSKITKRVEEGNPAKVIMDVADEIEPDMIIMGSRGLSNLQGILIGSVSHKVSQLAKCTCVTVR